MLTANYEPTFESVKQHQVPDWFHDAKFGIFIHWGLYSVPAFAPLHKYAEWYLDDLRYGDGETREYHKKTFGESFSYDNFVPIFNEAIMRWNPDEMVELFKKVHAKYVVLVTKHHDGFTLWPSKYPNPNKSNYFASRDIVGELSAAVKQSGMLMGLYYSGIFDWSFKHVKPRPGDFAQDLVIRRQSKEYAKYSKDQWYELIDKYDPLILWNDIGMPDQIKIWDLFAYFYNKHPDGVINDRFSQIRTWMRALLRFPITKLIFNKISKKYQNAEKEPPEDLLKFHSDYLTPEYKTFNRVLEKKWECTRGIGFSFGYNQFETEKEYLTVEQLVHLFADIVSKDGNLILNVGPKADGSIPELQKKVLLGFGKWLDVNGEAIFNTRPWKRPEAETNEGIKVRFTAKPDSLYAIVLGTPKASSITIKNLKIIKDSKITLLYNNFNVDWNQMGNDLRLFFNLDIKDTPAITLKITPKP